MHNRFNLHFFENNKIDKSKWDECVQESSNGLLYARAFYLDNIACGWNALIGENYNWILPLTYKRKYAISYLYQPPFTQQLGVFSKPGIAVPYQPIIQYLQKHYKFWEINWNYATKLNLTDPSIQVNSATNYILNLRNNYESIAANYHQDLIKNLKRSRQFKHVYKANNDYNKCIGLYRECYGKRTPHVNATDYKNFYEMCAYALQIDMLLCREVVNENGTLLAIALLLFDGKRLYNLMNTTTDTGRRTEANHFLIDAIIKEFSGRDAILDFEGSDLPGVKKFYENFGVVNQPFLKLKYNDLSWPLKIFKK